MSASSESAPVETASDEPRPNGREGASDIASLRVVMLTNFVPPYRLPLYEALSDRLLRLVVLVSTPVESNRSWRPDTGRLDVRVQHTLSVRRSWRHPGGFSEPTHVHVPWDTMAQLRRLRPDVIVSGELGFRSLFAALHCMGRGRPKLVLWATLSERTEHGRGRLRHVLRAWLLRRANRVIVNGASGERYVQGFGVPRDRIDRIPYVASPAFGDAGTAPRAGAVLRHLLFAGQLTGRKGLVPFLEKLGEWSGTHPDREITLTVAGSGPAERALESFRSRGPLTIRLLGQQDPNELPALFAQADAFVFPTLADEWGVVVNEALAAGLPVLGSVHSQAVEELCEDGVTGWVFDPEDEDSTRSAIQRALATEPDELEAMRAHARERVRSLTPEWAAGRVLATIRATLSTIE
jgi:glycosyltransferase involved in cell wall biosynthesis